jgi:thiamine pyrophosphokinase
VLAFFRGQEEMERMIINILAGGPEELLPDLKVFNDDESIWVGVDRGVFTLLSIGLMPFASFGDFDSVTEEEWQEIQSKVTQLEKFIPEKDETDTELALNWAVSKKPRLIRLFGATGGRIDHFLANIQLLLKHMPTQNGCEIHLIDNKNIVYIKGTGSHSITELIGKKYISFVPATMDVAGLTLSGFKFPLTNRHISIGSTLCISNELISDHGTFSFTEGILIVIRSQD